MRLWNEDVFIFALRATPRTWLRKSSRCSYGCRLIARIGAGHHPEESARRRQRQLRHPGRRRCLWTFRLIF